MASPRQQEVDGPEPTSVCVERKRFSRCVKMSKVQMLRSVVNQRLTAAAEEIFGLFERTIAEYEEELSSSKEENERQRKLLDAVFNPEVRTQGIDTQVVQEEVPPEQEDWSSPHIKEDEEDPEPPHIKEDEEDPEPPYIKEEQEELWISQEGEHLEELEEAGIKFSFSPVTSEDDDEDSGEPEPDVQQLLVVNEDVSPEQQDWSSSMDQEDQEDPEPPHIKEEQEELWISQEGEQPQGLKEADIKFPFAPVKSEDDDEDDEDEGQSSQLHRNQTEKNREAGSLKKADGKEVRSISEKHTESKTSAKPFQCSVCGKTFARQRFLSQHMTVHTGEKPFSCSVCDKTFARKGNLKYHMTVHTGEKPFSCSVCGKKFPLEQTMKRHLIVHSEEKPFSCSVCGKTFPLEQTLKRHLTVHSEEKPFSCSFCGKTFALRGRLNCHMTVHTGGESIQFYENIE